MVEIIATESADTGISAIHANLNLKNESLPPGNFFDKVRQEEGRTPSTEPDSVSSTGSNYRPSILLLPNQNPSAAALAAHLQNAIEGALLTSITATYSYEQGSLRFEPEQLSAHISRLWCGNINSIFQVASKQKSFAAIDSASINNLLPGLLDIVRANDDQELRMASLTLIWKLSSLPAAQIDAKDLQSKLAPFLEDKDRTVSALCALQMSRLAVKYGPQHLGEEAAGKLLGRLNNLKRVTQTEFGIISYALCNLMQSCRVFTDEGTPNIASFTSSVVSDAHNSKFARSAALAVFSEACRSQITCVSRECLEAAVEGAMQLINAKTTYAEVFEFTNTNLPKTNPALHLASIACALEAQDPLNPKIAEGITSAFTAGSLSQEDASEALIKMGERALPTIQGAHKKISDQEQSMERDFHLRILGSIISKITESATAARGMKDSSTISPDAKFAAGPGESTAPVGRKQKRHV